MVIDGEGSLNPFNLMTLSELAEYLGVEKDG